MRRRAEKYEILFTRKDAPESFDRRKTYRTKTIRYGEMIDVECYPVWDTRGTDSNRASQNVSSEAQEKLNLANRRKHVRRLVGCNFGSGDIMITLTYDYEAYTYWHGKHTSDSDDAPHVPMADTDAARDLSNYISRARRWAKKNGVEDFRWLSVTEVGKENADAPRKYHHHILMHGIPHENAEALWNYGRANSKALQPDRQGLNALSGYICKSRAFYRQFRHSSNLKKPVETVSDRKISSAKVRRIAADVQTDGREILEKAYPEYELAYKIDVRYSDYVAGAYIYATMHRRMLLPHDKGGFHAKPNTDAT